MNDCGDNSDEGTICSGNFRLLETLQWKDEIDYNLNPKKKLGFKLWLHFSFLPRYLGAICSTEMFSCDGKRCISSNSLCNGKMDCTDGSDEADNCTSMMRKKRFFTVQENKWLCLM